MPSKIEEEDLLIDDAPTDINPYHVLDLAIDSTQDEIKTAYRKAALRYHPDKAPPNEKETAHTKFQEVAFAYAILSDERRRKRYDTTGRTEESLDDDDFDWGDFFREQFANAVTTEAIDKFQHEYKGGEEEREHLLAAYEKHEGAMGKIYQDVMLSDVLDDDERFRKIIDEAIESGEVEGNRNYTHETEKSKKARLASAKKRRDLEAKEADKTSRELEEDPGGKAKAKQKGGMGDLAAMIQQRQQGRAENFFENLEAKYAPKGTKRAVDEPSEEAFAKNREGGRKKRTKR